MDTVNKRYKLQQNNSTGNQELLSSHSIPSPSSHKPLTLSITVCAPTFALSSKLSASGLTNIQVTPTTCNPFFSAYSAALNPIRSARFSFVLACEGAAVSCVEGKSVVCGAEEGVSRRRRKM